MKGIDLASLTTGVIMTVAGLILTIVGLFIFPLLFWSLPLLIIGIVILATLKKQEAVEEIKTKSIKTKRGRK